MKTPKWGLFLQSLKVELYVGFHQTVLHPVDVTLGEVGGCPVERAVSDASECEVVHVQLSELGADQFPCAFFIKTLLE